MFFENASKLDWNNEETWMNFINSIKVGTNFIVGQTSTKLTKWHWTDTKIELKSEKICISGTK